MSMNCNRTITCPTQNSSNTQKSLSANLLNAPKPKYRDVSNVSEISEFRLTPSKQSSNNDIAIEILTLNNSEIKCVNSINSMLHTEPSYKNNFNQSPETVTLQKSNSKNSEEILNYNEKTAFFDNNLDLNIKVIDNNDDFLLSPSLNKDTSNNNSVQEINYSNYNNTLINKSKKKSYGTVKYLIYDFKHKKTTEKDFNSEINNFSLLNLNLE